jgi:hypothetical protein
MTTPEPPQDDRPDDLRQTAITRLGQKRDLQTHVLAYVLVNLALNGIWLLTNPGGFYWPMFPLLIWGIGLAFHIWDFFVGKTPSEEAIRAEMDRLGRR